MDLRSIESETELDTLFDYIDDIISAAEDADEYIDDDGVRNRLSSEVSYLTGKLKDVKENIGNLQQQLDDVDSKVQEVKELIHGD